MFAFYDNDITCIDMIARRLTKTQKNEIVKGYRSGEPVNQLAIKFNCSSNTINRTVKTLISDEEYQLLKGKRLKFNKNKENKILSERINQQQEDLGIFSNELKSSVENKSLKDLEDNNEGKIDQDSDQKFEEIPHLESNFDFNIDERKINIIMLDNENLPESVYMLVDKKVELEYEPISNFPDWSFLPEDELKRNAILLFPNQRSAKRSCGRNQRVIKIPNTKIFQTTKHYLLSKGITRLILEGSLISLNN